MNSNYNITIQRTARRNQLAAVRRQINSGAYSQEDIHVLRNKEATLVRILSNLDRREAFLQQMKTK